MADEKIVARRGGWWAGRSLRERQLILAMLALLALVITWFLVLRPLSDARARADAQLADAATALGSARAQALMARQAPAGADLPGSEPVPLPLDGFVGQQAAEQGFTNIEVTAQGADRARITIANARAQPFLAWIGQLEARGVTVESLTARANADQTVAVAASLRAGRPR